ncbi:MAG: DNA internalization-related competence protein ComEC/Rec2 [Planctomycetota bacterium]
MRPEFPRTSGDPVLLASLGLALGILVADGASRTLCLALTLAASAAAVLMAVLARAAPPGDRRRALQAGLVPLLALLAVGLIRAAPASQEPLPAGRPPGSNPPLVVVEGTVSSPLMPSPVALAGSKESATTLTSYMTLQEVTLDAGRGLLSPSGKILVRMPPGDRVISRGTIVRVRGPLLTARSRRNPGQADPRAAWRRLGIIGLVRSDPESGVEVIHDAHLLSLLALIDQLRAALLRHLRNSLSPAAAGLSASLLLGTRDGLDPDLEQAILISGTLHLFAISGLHIGLVIGAARALLGLLLLPSLADLAAVLLALVYAGLAGAGSPILRASVGCAVFFFGRCLGRRTRPFTSISLAAIILLLLEPSDLFRPGFQLSFAAVSGLVLAGTGRAPRVWWRLPVEALRVSLSAAVATAPFLLFHFGRVSPLGPLNTILVTPLFLPTFAASLLHGFLGAPLRQAGQVLAHPVEIGTSCLDCFFRTAAEIPGATIHMPRPGTPLFLLLILLGGRVLWKRTPGSAVAFLLALLLAANRGSPPDTFELWMFDVGHGQAILIRSPAGGEILVDCGSRGRSDLGARTLLPALDSLGVARVDTLVISHSDADHLNGAVDLVRAGRVAALVHGRPGPGLDHERTLCDAADRHGVKRTRATRGDLILDQRESGIRVEVLAPAGGLPERSDNDDSLVLQIEVAGRVILLPGDLETGGIQSLLALEPELRCDLLILPHHGNRQPLLGPLLHQTRPWLTLASRPGRFEAGEVPLLAARVGSWLLSTADSGAIVVRIRTDGTIHAEGLVEPVVPQQVTTGS